MAIGGGLAVGVRLATDNVATAAEDNTQLGTWVIISADDTVTVRTQMMDIGYGGQSVTAQFVCEELPCDWSKLKVEYARPDDTFKQQVFQGKPYAVSDKRPSRNILLMQQAGA